MYALVPQNALCEGCGIVVALTCDLYSNEWYAGFTFGIAASEGLGARCSSGADPSKGDRGSVGLTATFTVECCAASSILDGGEVKLGLWELKEEVSACGFIRWYSFISKSSSKSSAEMSSP